MADPNREALQRLLDAEAHIHVAGPEYQQARDAAIAALAAEPPAPAEPVATLHVSDFRGYENYEFQHLVDLPPGHYKLFTACTAQPPAPAPAADGERDHVPDAGNMVAADGEAEELATLLAIGSSCAAGAKLSPEQCRRAAALLRQPAPAPVPAADGEHEELAQWLERIGDDYDDLYRSPSALIRPKLTRAAALLREARPQPVPGWQPIDTAPHDGTEILASDYDAIEILTWSWDAWETGSGWIDRNGQRLFPAWWQPLPDHPPIPQPPQANTTHPTPTEPPTND